MKKQRVQFLIIISSFFLIAYFLQGLFVLDPDFGWHVRIGEIIAKNGIPYTDPLSYTMPSYPFVSHEWLVDLITYHIYPTVGLFGLAFVYGLIALSALLLQIIRKSKKWAVLPLFLSGIVLLSFAGIRPQVISWFFFSLLLFIIFTKRFSVYKYFLPLLFALWANVHGGFAVGIVVLGIYFLCNTWEKKKIVVTDIIIFFLSVLATGVTPYGYRVWWEIWTSLSDSSLRWSIQEWMPAVFVFQPALWIFVTLAFGLYIKYRKRLSTAEQVLPIVLFLMGLSSIRHMPFWILCMLPVTAKTIEFFYEDAVKFQFGASRFTKAYIGLSIIAGAFVLPELYGAYVSFHQDKITYPEKAVVFLHEHPSSGNMFSTYEWGGYLDWKLPGKKVFIDGRMPSWRWKAPENEENNAFQTYKDIFAEKMPFIKIQKKYSIDTVLLHRPGKMKKSTIYGQIDTFVSNKLLHQKSESEFNFAKQLKAAGMRKMYEDDVSVIYRIKSRY